jgi:hypothetical protein
VLHTYIHACVHKCIYKYMHRDATQIEKLSGGSAKS